MRFFFSSRRRHTRYIGDWSSDVCSSDLSSWRCTEMRREQGGHFPQFHEDRSEERRVGKECRARWRQQKSKNKKETQRETSRQISAVERSARTRKKLTVWWASSWASAG